MNKFPSEKLAEKWAAAKNSVREKDRQEGRQEVIDELQAKGVEVPDEVKAKAPNPPSNE